MSKTSEAWELKIPDGLSEWTWQSQWVLDWDCLLRNIQEELDV